MQTPARAPTLRAILLLLLIAGIPATAWAQPQRITVDPVSLDFGQVPLGDRASASLTIRNEGGRPLTVQRLDIAPAQFSLDTVGPFTVGPQQASSVTVVFAPTVSAPLDGLLQIDSDDPVQPVVNVRVRGSGLAETRRPAFDVEVTPNEVRLAPGDTMQVTYSIEERAGRPMTIRAGTAYVEMAGGRRIDLAVAPLVRQLAAGERVEFDDGVVVPEAFFDTLRAARAGGSTEALRFVRSFVATADGQQEVRTATVRLIPSGSLSADFAVTTVSVDYPTAGTTVGVGEPLRAHAWIFGSGSGSVLGAWRVDGIQVDVFSIDLTAGRAAQVESRFSLPTAFIGLHELELEIQEPRVLRAPPVRYFVTSVPRSAFRVIHEAGFRVYLRTGALPEWIWTPAVGARQYAITIDETLSLKTDTTQFTLPRAVRDTLSLGDHRIAVRPLLVGQNVDFDGDQMAVQVVRLIDRPLPISSSANQPDRWTWEGPPGDGLFVLVVVDAQTRSVLLRKVTTLRGIALEEIRRLVPAGRPVEWRVEALNDHGEVIAQSTPLTVSLPLKP